MISIAAIPNAINTQPYNSAIQTAAKACTPPFIASHIGIKTEPVSDAASIFLVYIGFVSIGNVRRKKSIRRV